MLRHLNTPFHRLLVLYYAILVAKLVAFFVN